MFFIDFKIKEVIAHTKIIQIKTTPKTKSFPVHSTPIFEVPLLLKSA
ncbi:hypothetical protein [Staphylococcus hominis]|nr:hypothetical protein [Staphylococcus hominis]QKH82826.1 hypothetical protein FOC68_11175 [Staphylococcus hominis]